MHTGQSIHLPVFLDHVGVVIEESVRCSVASRAISSAVIRVIPMHDRIIIGLFSVLSQSRRKGFEERRERKRKEEEKVTGVQTGVQIDMCVLHRAKNVR